MKIIKDFEGEDLEVSDFGEWIGKDYIDYKSEYKSNQKLIKILLQENQQLKEQQKEFINYLKSMLENEKDNFSVARVKDVLEKYKKIIGGKDELQKG